MKARPKKVPPARKGKANRPALSLRLDIETHKLIADWQAGQLSKGEVVDKIAGHAKRTEFQPVSLL